mmetsp:Transcript_80569/g.218187  ORF Transcript_80569/g.218187 Transcript_80569/m.218187 type:complete len:135 (+) Transcript_80569:95-499(+)
MAASMSPLLLMAVACASVAPGVSASRLNLTIPSNQKVTIDGVEVYSQSAGFGILNSCQQFASEAVSDESKPSITVCGTGTKVTVYLRNRCVGYHEYSHSIGACDSSAASTTCVTDSPATVQWMSTAQSYTVEQC